MRDRRGGGRGRPFARKYAAVGIRLLAEVDEAYGQMSGLATREVLRRQFEVYRTLHGSGDFTLTFSLDSGLPRPWGTQGTQAPAPRARG